MNKPKGKVFFAKRKNVPPCLGDEDIYETCAIKKTCEHETECARKCADVEKDRNREREINKEKMAHRWELFKRFCAKYFKLSSWIDLIQSFEPLIMVAFIDLLALIVLVGAIASIYFLFSMEWRYVLCSLAICIALSFILERIDRTKETNERGE